MIGFIFAGVVFVSLALLLRWVADRENPTFCVIVPAQRHSLVTTKSNKEGYKEKSPYRKGSVQGLHACSSVWDGAVFAIAAYRSARDSGPEPASQTPRDVPPILDVV